MLVIYSLSLLTRDDSDDVKVTLPPTHLFCTRIQALCKIWFTPKVYVQRFCFKSIMTFARNVDELSEAYEKTVSATLVDHHAPLVTKTWRTCIRQPSYNLQIHQARRLWRKHEKKWRKTRLEIHLYIEHNKHLSISMLANLFLIIIYT